MARICGICGSQDADILCSRCGRFVCERCYNEPDDACLRCAPRASVNDSTTRRQMLMPGLILLFAGLIVTAMALVPGFSEGEGVIIFFPFFVGGVTGWGAALASLLFFAIFFASSLLPLLLSMSGRSLGGVDGGWFPFQSGKMSGVSFVEKTEYIITTELPGNLRESIYFESFDGRFVIKSDRDESFTKSYGLPKGFRVDKVDHEYDDDYLVLKVHLVKGS